MQRRHWALEVLRREGVRSVRSPKPHGSSECDKLTYRCWTSAAVPVRCSRRSSSPLRRYASVRSEQRPETIGKKQQIRPNGRSSSRYVGCTSHCPGQSARSSALAAFDLLGHLAAASAAGLARYGYNVRRLTVSVLQVSTTTPPSCPRPCPSCLPLIRTGPFLR